MEQKTYPDVSHIFAAKEERRRRLAALPWEEKVKIIEKMREAMPRRVDRARMMHTLVMPIHDPAGLLFPHLVAITPQLRELVGRVVISITPATRTQQAQWVEPIMMDNFFSICEFTKSLPVGDEFVQLYAHAATICPPDTLLHLCFIDRIAYALHSPYRDQFMIDIRSVQPNIPLIFHRSAAAWATHPRNYQALEAMLTVIGEGYFHKTLDFAWCHLVVPAGQLQAILPQVRRHDLAVCAELVLLLKGTIQTREVDWLAWEDPFIFGGEPEQLKREREQSPAETQKRLNYVLPMLEAIHQFHAKHYT